MSKDNTFYITTPIYYPSDKLHIGHSYCTVATDTMARYKRMQGFDVLFLTGTDEHGQKIELKAKEKGVTPKAFVDDVVSGIQKLWKLMNISNDRFIRTTDDYHEESVRKIFKTLYDKGDIYKSFYKGKYCTPCESFWTETQLVDGKCPDCGRDVIDSEEEAYFFRLSKYSDKLMEYYNAHPDFVEPQSRLTEMINNFIKPGLEDLCVSRTTFTWGVQVDFDPKHVVYVWIDALSNYITALGYGNDKYNDFDRYWPADVHFVGKEITRFHTIIWPAMLMALDLPLPKKVFAHGWLLLDGGKMSKSKGNVVDPVVLCERYGVDTLRYFLLREFPFGSDGIFSNEALINRINADLANDLGNLVSRTVSMVEKYFNCQLPLEQLADPIDEPLVDMANALRGKYETQMENYAFQNALTETFKVISRANKYIDETSPWIVAKDEANKPRLAKIMYNLLETIRISSVLLSPFMPDSCKKIWEQVGVDETLTTWQSVESFGQMPADICVKKGDTLFPRIDLAKELEELEKNQVKEIPVEIEPAKTTVIPGIASLIEFGDFAKVDLRVVEVLECENVKKSKKLLKFKLDDGMGGRQILSGIAQYYKPEELVGKKLIAVINLEPRVMMGTESQGMLLSAECSETELRLLMVDSAIPNGSKIG